MPEEARSRDVKRPTRNDDLLVSRDIYIRQIGNEDKIIRLHSRTHEQRTGVPERQHQFRQVPRAMIKNAVFAEAERFDVAVAVEYSKARAIFQNACAVVC